MDGRVEDKFIELEDIEVAKRDARERRPGNP